MLQLILLIILRNALAEFQPNIVGGDYANIRNFPHSAFLIMFAGRPEHAWICGSSILNQRILITAAHCFEAAENNKLEGFIRVGNANYEKAYGYKIGNHKVHERYDPNVIHNDIALVWTASPITFSNTVSRVAVLLNPPLNEDAYVAGWGLIDEDRMTDTKQLKFLKQRVVSRQECEKVLTRTPPKSICAKSADGKGAAAQGDSGSALIVRGFIQIGLVSYKIPQTSRVMVVFTEVSKFVRWIDTNANRFFCNSYSMRRMGSNGTLGSDNSTSNDCNFSKPLINIMNNTNGDIKSL